MTDDKLFRGKVPRYMRQIMADFDCGQEDAAAVFGNIGTECNGFHNMQEISPTAGRGGLGWCQWTAARRRAYEAYCARNHRDPLADDTNYAYLFVELTTTEKSTMPAVKKATGLKAKVVAFEERFERAGVKNYDSRIHWAEIALDALRSSGEAGAPPPVPSPPPPVPASPKTPPAAAAGYTGLGALLVALLSGLYYGAKYLLGGG